MLLIHVTDEVALEGGQSALDFVRQRAYVHR